MGEQKEATELKNTVTIEEAGPCKKRVTVEMPAERVQEATDEQYEELRKEAIVPGFRKGRAPRRLLEKRFGKETDEQIKLKLLADASDSAIKDNELDVLRDPDIDFEKIEVPATGPLKFDFEVEVRPEFDLPRLEGVPVEKKKLEVTDEQVSREIEQLRRWSGVWAPRQSGAAVEVEDQIIADAMIKTETAEEEEKLDNIEIYVRENGFVGAIPVERLDKLLVGAKTGDVKQTSVEVPKTYFREEYRGKKADIRITVKDIKWLRPAELDENFLKRFGVDDQSELREKVRDKLKSQLEAQVRAEMTEQIYKYMLDNTDFDLPTDVVGEHSTALLQRQYTNLLRRGLAREQIEER
ncbi:MAG: trigger factor, partial [Planctomycetota bacterium]